MTKYLIPMLCVFALIAACDLERDIDVNLPAYESEIVIESYIQPGESLRALITESVKFTDLPSVPLDEDTPIVVLSDGEELTVSLSLLEQIIVAEGDTLAEQQFLAFKSAIASLGLNNDASVMITHNGTTHMLEQGIYFDFDNFKLYNYSNPFIVPADYNNDFSIEVNSEDRTATAMTQLLPPVPFDSIVYSFNASDTLAAIQAWFTDDVSMDNYYRIMIHGNNLTDTIYQDATINDRFFNGDDVPLGSDFNFGIGDTSIVTLFHIDEAYHDFAETYEEAFFANGNPFSQSVQILTNVDNGLGIFTGLSYVRDTVIIE